MVAIAIVAFYVVRREKTPRQLGQAIAATPNQIRPDQSSSAARTNALGDILADAQDPVFLNKAFPKFREFLGALDRIGANPLHGEVQPSSCGKIRITQIPNGMLCQFVIGDGWAAQYTENSSFSGITYFGQRGPENPNRAISHADTNALHQLSQGAIIMPQAQVWTIANRVAETFGIDGSKFEKPEMYEQGLFDYHLGIYGVRYRKKGSDPINQLNYTREFSLKATSSTTAVLVSYMHLDAR